MEITNEKQAFFNQQLTKEMDLLRGLTLADEESPNYNPSVTYGSILSEPELGEIAKLSPNMETLLNETRTPEEIIAIQDLVAQISERRIKPYNRAPVDFSIEERFPRYDRELKSYNSGVRSEVYGPGGSMTPTQKGMLAGVANMPVGERQPRPPMNFNKMIRIAGRGFDPQKELTFEDVSNGMAFRTKKGFGPRVYTLDDWRFLGEQHGLDGDYMYNDPMLPSDGAVFRAKGTDEWLQINSPEVTGQDVYNFLINEVPAIAGDIGLSVVGIKRYSTAFGMTGTLADKGKGVLKLSGMSALGATGGDFLRLTAGKLMGAHDRDFMDIIKEAGLMGALTFAGTATISAATTLIPALWKTIFNQNVPPEFLDDLKKLYDIAADKEAKAAAGISFGDDLSMDDLFKNIDELVTKMADDPEFLEIALKMKENYQPTLASQTGSFEAADLEAIFLKYADDPSLAAAYEQIKKGNQQALEDFVRILNEKIGTKLGADVTGAEVGQALRAAIQKSLLELEEESYRMLDNVRSNLEADDLAVTGESLLKQVPDNRASTPLFERTQKRLKLIRDDYTNSYRDIFKNTLSDPKYTDLKTGAGYTRTPTKDWMTLTSKDSKSLLAAIGGKKTKEEIFSAADKQALKRLRGMNSRTGKFANGDEISFTLDELNATRESLNSFVSQSDDPIAKKYARELERGLEKQMWKLVEDGAADVSKLDAGSPELLTWMEKNKYGFDIRTAWKNQAKAIKTANSEAIMSILSTERPEKIAEYLLGTGVPNSAKNLPISQLMQVLKKDGSDVVLDMQKGLAEYIRRNIFEAPDLSAFQISKKYRTFMTENQGTLEAIFGKDGFKQSFKYSRKAFERDIIDKLRVREETIKEIRDVFGVGEFGELSGVKASNSLTNIVTEFLARGPDEMLSGELLKKIEIVQKIAKNDPVLKEQIAQVTKNYLTKQFLTSQPGIGGRSAIDGAALENLLYGKFGPAGVVGEKLTFENFMVPLLGGGAEGKEFVKQLKFLNDMVQREIGPPITAGVAKKLGQGEYGVGSPIEGARMVQRLLIAPLTITGRRITALSARVNNNARELLGRMMQDEELFKEVAFYAQGRTNTQHFIRFLSAYDLVAAQDLASDIAFYSEQEKAQKERSETYPNLDKIMRSPKSKIFDPIFEVEPYVPEYLKQFDPRNP